MDLLCFILNHPMRLREKRTGFPKLILFRSFSVASYPAVFLLSSILVNLETAKPVLNLQLTQNPKVMC